MTDARWCSNETGKEHAFDMKLLGSGRARRTPVCTVCGKRGGKIEYYCPLESAWFQHPHFAHVAASV